MRFFNSGKPEASINRHFRWEALFMVALCVVPIVLSLAVLLIGLMIY